MQNFHGGHVHFMFVLISLYLVANTNPVSSGIWALIQDWTAWIILRELGNTRIFKNLPLSSDSFSCRLLNEILDQYTFWRVLFWKNTLGSYGQVGLGKYCMGGYGQIRVNRIYYREGGQPKTWEGGLGN